MLEAVASGVGAAASDCGSVSGTCEASPDEAPLIPPFESELAFEAVVPESVLVRNVRAMKKPPTPRTRATAATSAMTTIVVRSPRATFFSAFICILSLCCVCACNRLLRMALTADHAATDQCASNLTVIRDTSNIQPRSSGKTRLTTRQPRNPQPCPPLASRTRASHPRLHNPTQASRTHPSHPQLPNNVACNSPTTLSMFEIRSLKSCGFHRVPKRPCRGIACEIS